MIVIIIAALSFMLSWDPAPAIEAVDSTIIFRSTRAAADPVRIGATAGTVFLDSNIEPGQRYFYLTRFKRGEEFGPWSNEVSGAWFDPEGMDLAPDTLILSRSGAFTSHDLLVLPCQGLPVSVEWDGWKGTPEIVTVNAIWNQAGDPDKLDLSDLSLAGVRLFNVPSAWEAFARYYNRTVRFGGVVR